MKKHRLFLFGLPTLFTVLIVILIISFSTLSYLNTLNIRHSIQRGNQILTESYEIQSGMELTIIDLEEMMNMDKISVDEKYDWTYDRIMQIITIERSENNLSLRVKLNVVFDERIKLKIIEWKLESGNNQDYTKDGDPVYGG